MAVVVVVVVVLALLAVLGLPPFNRAGSSPSLETYSQAAATAESSAPGGSSGWSVFAAIGVDSATSNTSKVTVNGSSFSSLGCSVKELIANGSSVTLPAFHGSLSAGAAPVWGFALISGTQGLYLTYITSGSAIPVFQVLPSSGCLLSILTSFAVPSNVVDSPVAAQAAWGAAGSAFVSAHPGAGQVMSLTPSLSSVGSSGSSWNVTYFACNATTARTALVATQSVQVGLTNGTAFKVGAVESRSCPFSSPLSSTTGPPPNSPTPLGTAIALGAPQNVSNASGYLWRFPVVYASGLTWADISFEVQTPAGAIVSVPGGSVTVRTPSGMVTGIFRLTQGMWAPIGGTVSAGETLELLSGSTSLAGDSLVMYGQGTFTGAVATAIP